MQSRGRASWLVRPVIEEFNT
eukprot:COSAG02_NODE_10181_length_2000_cov_2.042083_3_plen_20_part_01